MFSAPISRKKWFFLIQGVVFQEKLFQVSFEKKITYCETKRKKITYQEKTLHDIKVYYFVYIGHDTGCF